MTIQEGGPQVNHTQLLLAGRLDFNISGNAFLALNLVKENIPFRTIAGMFQKDPVVLIAHPGVGNDSFPALKGKPIMIGADSRVGWWTFLKAKFGYSDSQIRPYTFNLAPFLSDKNAIQQGYLGSEPFSIEQEAHFTPVVLLVADAGLPGLRQYDHDLGQENRAAAGSGEALRRCLDRGLVFLSLRRSNAWEHIDQAGQPGDERRIDRLWDRFDEVARYPRFGRCADHGNWGQ